MDRRKRKSRKAIFDACVTLSKEKEFQNITVNEIVERADLNRGTFYLHFNDKFDMMNSFEAEMIEKIESVLMNNFPKDNFEEQFVQSRYETVVQILRCYEENQELLQLLMNSGHNKSFQTKLRETLKILIAKEVFPKLSIDATSMPIDLFTRLFTSISLNLAEYTYESDESIEIETLAKILIKASLQGVPKALGIDSMAFLITEERHSMANQSTPDEKK